MWIGLTVDAFWKFANEQKLLLDDAVCVGDSVDSKKRNAEIWIKLDSRYQKMGKSFKGFVFFAHIEATLSVSREGHDALNQFQNMFPEINQMIKRIG